MEYWKQTRLRMQSMGVSQKEVIELLIAFDLYKKEHINTLRSSVSMALTGKRTSAKYKRLLDDINFVLDSK